MFFIAHAGHEHPEEKAGLAVQQIDSLNYGALLITAIGLCLLFVGIVLLITAFKKKTTK